MEKKLERDEAKANLRPQIGEGARIPVSRASSRGHRGNGYLACLTVSLSCTLYTFCTNNWDHCWFFHFHHLSNWKRHTIQYCQSLLYICPHPRPLLFVYSLRKDIRLSANIRLAIISDMSTLSLKFPLHAIYIRPARRNRSCILSTLHASLTTALITALIIHEFHVLKVAQVLCIYFPRQNASNFG